MKEKNIGTNLCVFPKLIGKISNKMIVQNKFNRIAIKQHLPTILSPSTAAKDIETCFQSTFGNKFSVITLLVSINGIGYNAKDKHTSVGIFRKCNKSHVECKQTKNLLFNFKVYSPLDFL